MCKDKITDTLVVIPARGGSKGVPGKNIKALNGKPLIYYTIDAAREVVRDADICVSTDDETIISVVEQYGLKVPFTRPLELANDTTGTYEVLLHALRFYESKGVFYKRIVLLQPTSPFRTRSHIKEALKIWSSDLDMIVSVKETKSNPYFVLFEEDTEFFLGPSKKGGFMRRQDCPKVWEYNGAMYIINISSLKSKPLNQFRRIKKFVMDELCSHDIDTLLDWKVAELIMDDLSDGLN